MARYDVRPAQIQRAEQRLLMQPRMLQSIEILTLPTLELVQFLAEKALENEALVVEDPREERRIVDDLDWRPKSVAREATERHDEILQGLGDRARSVAECALDQVALLGLDMELESWVKFVVGCLDDNGWICAEDADLLALAHGAGLEPSHDLLARAIACVQRLEPRGIGGRNALESLLLQLDPRDEDYAHLCRLVEEFLDDLSRNKRPAVARALGVDAAQLESLLEKLSVLDPRPGRSLAPESAQSIQPDIVVERTDAGFDVRVERSRLPAVSVDPSVVRQSSDRTQSREVRAWLRGKVEEARWLVEAVEGRRATLLRVAICACHHQQAFLEHGPGSFAPLKLSTVASELGLAPSTVSRAVADKHVETPFGIVPLRRFFQSSAGGSSSTAVEDIRDSIRTLFADEDRAHPLSDDDAVLKLASKGIRLSRRSIAKHRAALGIQSSYLRRRHA